MKNKIRLMVLVCVSLFIALSVINSSYYFQLSHLKRTVDSYRGYQGNTQCTNILSEMTNGHWRKKNDISNYDLVNRARMDLYIRQNRFLPLRLTRDDLRCGTKFPLVDRGFGYQLPALCNASGNTPCCNDVTGRCGSDISDCTCPECTNFRKIYSAELCNWESNNGCKMTNFTSHAACKLMNDHVSSLVLIGDSLMRHFHNALMILFTNNPHGGALRKDLTKEQHEACSGEMQFVDAGKTVCHGKISRQISEVESKSFCEGNVKFQYSFNESYCIDYAKGALAVVTKHLNRRNAVILIGVGLHDGLSFERITKHYMEPILNLVQNKARSGWPKIIWVTTHAHGSLKPVEFRGSQGNDKVIEFNRRMKDYLEPQGVDVFDVFNLTLGLHSYDGTHYGPGVNMMKVQLLMNYLRALNHY